MRNGDSSLNSCLYKAQLPSPHSVAHTGDSTSLPPSLHSFRCLAPSLPYTLTRSPPTPLTGARSAAHGPDAVGVQPQDGMEDGGGYVGGQGLGAMWGEGGGEAMVRATKPSEI